MHDTGLADRIRSAGVDVVEVAGWQTRGSATFAPRGFVWHHTAGPRKGAAPSLATCIYGRPGLPGPLCHVLLGRDGRAYVIAAGRANHAGSGSWAGLRGNSSVYGLEVENTGYGSGPNAEPWPPFLVDIAARIAAASGVPAEACCHHKEWAPARKVDMHSLAGNEMRARVAQLLAGEPPATEPPPPPAREDTDMAALIRFNEPGHELHGRVEMVGDFHRRHIASASELDRLRKLGGTVIDVSPAEWNDFTANKAVIDGRGPRA